MGDGSRLATIYKDEPKVLDEKICYLSKMIKRSKNVVIYTGAGISTSAGIGDIASDKKDRTDLNRL